MGRSRGGLTRNNRSVVDTNGLPVHLALTPGEAHDNRLCSVLLSALLPQTMLLADRGYDADWIRELARQQVAWANIPPKRNRKAPICFRPYRYRARNLVKRFFNKIQAMSACRDPTADGFRNYVSGKQRLSAEELLVDRAQLLTLTAPVR
jgi:transposase